MIASLRTETELPPETRIGARVGLLAGGGRFPYLFAEAARKRGIEVVCVAIRDNAESALKQNVDRFHWTGVAQLGKMIRLFRKEAIECVVMAGKVHKSVMYAPWRCLRLLPDWRFASMWLSKLRDRRDDSILLSIIEEFRRDGIRFASALEICPELLVKEGVLTRRKPSHFEMDDVEFGWSIAKEMGRLDVGQSVAVKEGAVIAVEAIEGTDAAIVRAGQLCRSGGFTVVKVAKPHQDMRFDVPTIGVNTIENLHRAGGKVLAIEADRTIVVDLEQTVDRANDLGITVIALDRAHVDRRAA